jgi:hypothetical protein
VTRVGGLGASHARGLPVGDKYRPFWVPSSISLKYRPRWDVAVGTHSRLALHTQVSNPSHHRSTSICPGHHPTWEDIAANQRYHEAMSLRTEPGIIHRIARESRGLKRMPRGLQNMHEHRGTLQLTSTN